MLRKNSGIWLSFAAAVALFGGVTLMSCGGGGRGGGGDSASYGQDIQGMYEVAMTTTYNTCPDGKMDVAKWFLSIEQNKDFSKADVYFQEEGAGSEKSKLFAGDVYGTLVILDAVQKTPMGGNCMQLQIQDYSLTIDLKTNFVQGTLIDNIVYVGDSCSPSTVSCRTERMIESMASPTDDDDNDDDDDSSPA